MENTIKPHKKYWTAQILILATISVITLISAGILHLIINTRLFLSNLNN